MILMRHGQSEFNVVYAVTRVDPGIEDPALTPAGRQQAAEASDRLSSHDLRRIVASPYKRTLHTAEIVADALGLPVSVEPLVGEHAVFACDVGTPASHLRRLWPRFDFGDLPETWWPRLGETDDQVRARCDQFHRSASVLADWSHVLVVTHWGFIRGLTGHELANGATVRFDPVCAGATAVVSPARAC